MASKKRRGNFDQENSPVKKFRIVLDDKNMGNIIREFNPKETRLWSKGYETERKKVWSHSCQNPPRSREFGIPELICDNHPLVQPLDVVKGSFPCCLPSRLQTMEDIKEIAQFAKRKFATFQLKFENATPKILYDVRPRDLEAYFDIIDHSPSEIRMIMARYRDDLLTVFAVYKFDAEAGIYYASYPDDNEISQRLWELAEDMPFDEKEWIEKLLNTEDFMSEDPQNFDVAASFAKKYGRNSLALLLDRFAEQARHNEEEEED